MEVLLVVGVIVVLAASAYKLYSMVQSNIQSSNEQNNVLTVIANMKSLKFQGRYTDSNYIKTLYAQGLLPSDMIADTTGASAKTRGAAPLQSQPLRINTPSMLLRPAYRRKTAWQW